MRIRYSMDLKYAILSFDKLRISEIKLLKPMVVASCDFHCFLRSLKKTTTPSNCISRVEEVSLSNPPSLKVLKVWS